MTASVRSLCLTVVLLLFASGPVLGQSEPASSDSTTSGIDWLILPYGAYAPETQIEGGLVTGAYFRTAPGVEPSQIRVVGAYTQERQIIAQILPDIYLPSGWRLGGEIMASRYPNSYFGIGGQTSSDIEETFSDRFVRIDGFAQALVRPNLRVGPRLFVRAGDVSDVEPGCGTEPDRADQLACGLVPGTGKTFLAGLGATARWDARNSIYYPTDGTFAEVSALWQSAAWGSDFTFGEVTMDARGYQPLGPGAIAGQVYGAAVLGTAPFQRLPQLGGDERMRGFRLGRFRDDVYWTTQVEYRLPVVWRLKLAAFASAGEVGPKIGDALFDDIETAAGVGGRFRFTDDGVHGRIDVAMGDDGVELYISIGEAF